MAASAYLLSGQTLEDMQMQYQRLTVGQWQVIKEYSNHQRKRQMNVREVMDVHYCPVLPPDSRHNVSLRFPTQRLDQPQLSSKE